jgi:hypothetical protein
LYWKTPAASELTAWKLKPSDFPEPCVEVWEENWDVIHLFKLYNNQWRMGPAGPVGLDFGVIHHALDRKGVTGDAYDDFIYDMRILEEAALTELYK